jgi:hypothetical protein
MFKCWWSTCMRTVTIARKRFRREWRGCSCRADRELATRMTAGTTNARRRHGIAQRQQVNAHRTTREHEGREGQMQERIVSFRSTVESCFIFAIAERVRFGCAS